MFDLVRGVLEISHRPTKERFTTERPGTSSEELQCAYSELDGCRSRRSRINIMTTAFWKLLGQPQLVVCLGAYGGTLRAPFKSADKERKKGFVVFFPLSPLIAMVFEACFQFASLSPARFELCVVGRPSRFASSRPAKKVKGSGQQVGGRCRTA